MDGTVLNKVLIVCRDLKSARRLRRFNPEGRNRYILASDDPRVHEAACKCLWLDEICWIEQMESFYKVADQVIHLTETVNEWLKTLVDDKNGFPEELLFFTRHVEGGMTTQRIQDLLLLIRSYRYLFDIYKINRIILLSQPSMGWEDDVLIATARNRNIKIEIIGSYSLSSVIKKTKSVSEICARSFYCTLNVLRLKLLSHIKSKEIKSNGKEIIFQLCSSAYKHVENIVPLMKALKNIGYNPVALCWHSNERYTNNPGVVQIDREGLKAEQLEQWCSFSDMWKSIAGVFWTWKWAKGKKREFLSHAELSYQSVLLGSLLWPSIMFFIVSELPQSYRLSQALKKYFKYHVPLAIKLWGGVALKDGFLMWKSLEPKNIPLIFFYAVGSYIDWPYEVPNSPIDLLFVAGEHHRRMVLKSKNILSSDLEICGQARYEGVEDFKKKYNYSQSRLHLRIPSTFSMYILYESGTILRGFMTQQEQVVILSALLKFAGKHPSVAILVKPHPSHNADILDDMINSRKDLTNVFLISNKSLPYHALNAVDMLITKFSTLAVEAMLLNRPVICCILDGEQRFNIYKNSADYIDRIENLEDLLLKLVTNNDFMEEWHNRHMQKQKVFLAEYFCKIEKPPAIYQASVLDNYIKKRLYPRMEI